MTTEGIARPRDPTIRLSARAGFAASAMILAGGFHLVNGYTTLEHKSYLASTNVIYNNLTFWGWAFLIWGAVSIIAGVMLWQAASPAPASQRRSPASRRSCGSS